MHSFDRTQTIEELLRSIHIIKHKFMIGYTAKKEPLITPSQACVLRFVAEKESVNVKSIAGALQISSSAATQLIDGLTDKGYLLRNNNPDDRRVISLTLSKMAKKHMEGFKKQGLKKMMSLFSALTDEELAQYAALNQKIVDSITHS